MSGLLPTPTPDDPVPIVAAWLAEAEAAAGRRNPNALALATADASGRPSVRMVLLKEIAPAGYVVFYTNYGSRKANQLAANARAAGVLYWEDTGRQVRLEGPVVRSPDAESDAYFATRHWRSQVNAWSSEQSRPLPDPALLEQRAAHYTRELGIDATTGLPPPGRSLPRPPGWGGFRLWLDTVELWTEGASRFHERLQYRRALEPTAAAGFVAGDWHWERLQP